MEKKISARQERKFSSLSLLSLILAKEVGSVIASLSLSPCDRNKETIQGERGLFGVSFFSLLDFFLLSDYTKERQQDIHRFGLN